MGVNFLLFLYYLVMTRVLLAEDASGHVLAQSATVTLEK